MGVSIAFFIVAALVVLIWAFDELKKMRHRFLAFFLIGLIIFTYVTFTASLQNQDVDLSTTSGWLDAGKLYFSWLGTVFVNAKHVTMYAIGLDWKNYDKNSTTTPTTNSSIWDQLK